MTFASVSYHLLILEKYGLIGSHREGVHIRYSINIAGLEEGIRLIYDKFANAGIGYGGVAQYLNLQGIKK